MPTRVITAATTFPVTLTEAKAHLKVDSTDDETLITALITAATAQCESYTWRTLITTVYELVLPCFASIIDIDSAPVSSITSVKYYDTNNAEQTLATTQYESDLISSPAQIQPKYGLSFPSTYTRFDAVTVRYSSGYANGSSVPAPIKQGMLMLIGHLYENREDVVTGRIVSDVPFASKQLWQPYRIYRFV